MKANMVIEIFPGKKTCTGSADDDCRFFNERTWYCNLLDEELLSHPRTRDPLRCQACLDTFKEDEE